MKKTYYVTFHYNKKPNGFMKKLYEHEYTLLRNKACDALNDHYEEWNAEFDRLYPGVNGEDPRYTRFIVGKQNRVLKELDDESMLIIMRSSADRDGDLEAISKVDWRTKFYITLTEA